MPIIDAQVHAYEKDRPERPWTAVLAGPEEMTGDQMVAAMDAVAVDAAILVSPYTMYRYDESYALDVYAAYPDRFALVKPVNVDDPGVAETVADWARVKGAIAARIMMGDGYNADPDVSGIARVLTAAGQAGIPVNLLCWGQLPLVQSIAADHPNTQIVIDHLGLKQPFHPPVPDTPFADLENVLALAALDNVAIKITGACTLSKSGAPFDDIWPSLDRIFTAYGLNRCLWGTDWTRAVNLITYRDGVDTFRNTTRLSDTDKAQLMGESLMKIYNWKL